MALNFIAAPNHEEIMQRIADKLASVNLEPDYFEVLRPSEVQSVLGISNAYAIKLAYYDLPNNTYSPRKLRPIALARYRLFRDALGEEAIQATQQNNKKYSARYWQPLGTVSDTYIPPNLDLDKFYNLNEPLYITEGELKAHAALSYGYQCIGLPGIDNFYHKSAHTLHTQLNKLPIGKQIVIVFDTEAFGPENDDGSLNTNCAAYSVLCAKNRLAAMLMLRGMHVHTIDLPAKDKAQLDDYLAAHKTLPPAKAFEFNEIDTKAKVRWLQSRYAILNGKPFNVYENKSMSFNDFCNHHANLFTNKKKATDLFKVDEYTLRLDSLTYMPQYTNRTPTPGVWNMFSGWGTWYGAASRDYDLSPFHEVMGAMFSEEPEILAEYYKTIAFMLQKPWIKQHRFILFRGSAEGTGKSFTLDLPRALINGRPADAAEVGKNDHAMSDNCATILEGDFNIRLLNKSYVVMSEVDDVGRKNTLNRLKAFVTEPELSVTPKFMDTYNVPNLLLLAITTNERRLFDINAASRRPLVLPCVEANSPKHKELLAMWEQKEKEGFRAWYSSQETREALMTFFMEYDLGGYTGTQRPPVSQGQLDLTDDNTSELGAYIDNLCTSDTVPLVIVTLEFDRYATQTKKHIHLSDFKNLLKTKGYQKPRRDRTHGQVQLSKEIVDKYGEDIVRGKLGSTRPRVLVQDHLYKADAAVLSLEIEKRYLKEGKL